MQPQLMYLLIVIAQRLLPYRCQMLRHNVFNRIGAVVTVTVYILILRCAEVLEALKKVNLILTVHQINWTFLKCRLKLHIVREASALLL